MKKKTAKPHQDMGEEKGGPDKKKRSSPDIHWETSTKDWLSKSRYTEIGNASEKD